MEGLLGSNVIKNNNVKKSTHDAMKEIDIVMVYFSASWCPPCRYFTHILTKFYEKCCKQKGVEIVFISSDQDTKSFTEYFAKMPWLSLPFKGTELLKQNLSRKFEVQGIPHLVVLDAKTAHFVTYDAKTAVELVGDNVTKGNDLIASWKAMKAVPIEQAKLSEKRSIFRSIVSYFLRYPMFVVALVFFVKKAMENVKEILPDETIENEL